MTVQRETNRVAAAPPSGKAVGGGSGGVAAKPVPEPARKRGHEPGAGPRSAPARKPLQPLRCTTEVTALQPH